MFCEFSVVDVELNVGIEDFCDFADLEGVDCFEEFRGTCLIEGMNDLLDPGLVCVVVVALVQYLEECNELVFR